jgi:RNA polymerase sigma factor (sigma-70 family)
MRFTIEEDRRLIKGCLDGDSKRLEEFIRIYSPLIYRYVQQTLTSSTIPFDEEDLKEHHNSVFVLLLEHKCKKLEQFKGQNGCSLASWVRLITCRTVLNKLREESGDANWVEYRLPIEEAADVLYDELSAMEYMELEEKKRFIRDCIKKLGSRDRLFLKLHVEQDLPVPKVARIMQMSSDNAHTLRYRAFDRLKKMVEKVLKKTF